jgi:hypothetical protein
MRSKVRAQCCVSVDHKAVIPAVTWTDTAEFRNHHYHQATDTPQTLDCDFPQAVTQVLIATVSMTV